VCCSQYQIDKKHMVLKHKNDVIIDKIIDIDARKIDKNN
jgi:hypothetical protein